MKNKKNKKTSTFRVIPLCAGCVTLLLTSLIFFTGCLVDGNAKKEEGKDLKYNTTLVETGLVFKKDFLDANRVWGLYWNEEWDAEKDDPEGRWLMDETSPGLRTFIVTDRDQLDEIFSVYPEIDFYKEIVLVIIFGCPHGGIPLEINSITLEGKNLKIKWKYKETKFDGYLNATMPQRRIITFKMDRLDIETVEFSEGR